MGITDDILRKGFRNPQKPVASNPSIADAVLSESGEALKIAGDRQPALGALEPPSTVRRQIAHVDNLSEISAGIPFRRLTTIETTTPLAANGQFTGAWHDAQVGGEVCVQVYSFSNVNAAGSAGAYRIEECDDLGNQNLLRQAAASGSSPAVSGGSIGRGFAFLKARYWRVVYINGGTVQANFELTSCAMNFPPGPETNGATQMQSGSGIGTAVVAQIPANGTVTGDGNSNNSVNTFNAFINSGNGFGLAVYPFFFNGSGWDRPRTPNKFVQTSTAATGSTALWTPAAGKKFRLMRYRVQVTGLAKAAAAADLVIDLLDAAASVGLKTLVTIQTTALTTNGVSYDSGWIDLGNGLLSALANNVLNLNLSFALTGGLVSVNVCGTEE